jgi:hypothetical protein
MNFILLTAIILGVATFMPGVTQNRRDWFGLRFLLAVMAIPAVLYLGNVVAGVPLDTVVRAFALAGAAGILLTFARAGRDRAVRREMMGRLAHPVWTLTLVVFLVAAMHRFPGYMPFPGDEMASWLRLTKQIFLANAYWSELLDYHLGAYTNGWPLMTAFPSLLWGRFNDGDLGPLPYLMHLGLIGASYDVLRDWCRRDGIENGLAGLFSALLVFFLVSVEALWVLYPSDMLIDRPLLYVWAAIFMLGLAGLGQPSMNTRLAAMIGFLAAVGYLLKVSVIGIVPSMGVAWLGWQWLALRSETGGLAARVKPALLQAALMLAPLALAWVSWSFFKTGEHCNATPWEAYDSPLGMFTTSKAALAAQFFERDALAYVSTWKVPMTVIGGAGLLAAMFDRRLRWFSMAVVAFVIFYSFAMYLSYIGCLDVEQAGYLQSFERYFRPNLRLVHFAGIVAGALVVWRFAVARGLAARAMDNQRFRFAGGFLVIVFLGALALQADRSMVNSTTRFLTNEPLRSTIVGMREEARYLVREIGKRGLEVPDVMLVAQAGYNVEFDLARYSAIREERNDADRLGYMHYLVSGDYNWGPEPGNFSLRVTTPEKLLARWRETDIVWPVVLDDWVRAVLTDLSGGGCDGPMEDFFLFRNGDGAFECVSKVERPGG